MYRLGLRRCAGPETGGMRRPGHRGCEGPVPLPGLFRAAGGYFPARGRSRGSSCPGGCWQSHPRSEPFPTLAVGTSDGQGICLYLLTRGSWFVCFPQYLRHRVQAGWDPADNCCWKQAAGRETFLSSLLCSCRSMISFTLTYEYNLSEIPLSLSVQPHSNIHINAGQF